jgi:cytochrome c peroxidase
MKRIKAWLYSALILFLTGICFSFFSVKHDQPYIFPRLYHFPPMPVSAANPVTVQGAVLGRYLFYDPILSADSSISCASCHKQSRAFSDGPRRFSQGIEGQLQKRNTPPLFNLAWYPRLFWDGRADGPESQVFHPVRNADEMNMSWKQLAIRVERSPFYRQKFRELYGDRAIDSSLIAMVIAQFERTLVSYRSKYDQVLAGKTRFTLDELEGMELVNDLTKGNCMHCHTTDGDALGTTGAFSNNGLDEGTDTKAFKDGGLGLITQSSKDLGKFKIPSLRNLLFTSPYMHDGRFNTLAEVLDFYSEGLKKSPTVDPKMEFVHQGGSRLNTHEKRKIILFLKTLSDSAFIADQEFSNPFYK